MTSSPRTSFRLYDWQTQTFSGWKPDGILSNLVEAVVAFGNSGLLPNDEDTLGAQKLTADAIGRTLSAVVQRKGP